MSSQLSSNLFLLRECTCRFEQFKGLSSDKFVKLVELDKVGVNGSKWNSYEVRGAIPGIKVLGHLRYKFNLTLDDLFLWILLIG